jgi:hypothetical protein
LTDWNQLVIEYEAKIAKLEIDADFYAQRAEANVKTYVISSAIALFVGLLIGLAL